VGEEVLEKLAQCNVLLVGLGGVGSYAGEFLVRSGIGSLTIIDGDVVDATNKNRQLPALDSTVGKLKSEIMAQRFLDVNPDLKLTVISKFMGPNDMIQLLEKNKFDFVLDCIDSITPKLTLILNAKATNSKVISSMGAGGKIDPSKVKIADISETKECKFAKCVRKNLKKNRIYRGVIAVYSDEIQPKSALKLTDGKNFKKSFYGTISYMPALFGLTMASEVIRRLGDLKG
jgi:tRNA A37 threonylcarbamoyladenosine dehydratase